MRYLVIAFSIVLTACANQGLVGFDTGQADATVLNRAKIHSDLASAYFAQGVMDTAIEEFNESIRILPSYAPAYAGLALVRSTLKQDDMAESEFKKSLQLDPMSSETHNNYGTFLCSRKRYDESIPHFLSAVKNPLYSTPESAYLNAGICSLRKNDEKNAEIYLLNALQINGSLNNARYQLANIYFKRGNLILARKQIDYLVNNNPTAEMLWLGIQVEKGLNNPNTADTYSMLLRSKYPDSEQARSLTEEP